MSAARGCNKLQTDRADQFVESLKLNDNGDLSFNVTCGDTPHEVRSTD